MRRETGDDIEARRDFDIIIFLFNLVAAISMSENTDNTIKKNIVYGFSPDLSR